MDIPLKIIRNPPMSDHVEQLAYHSEDETLEIAYRTGAVIRYYDFPEEEFKRLITATAMDLFLSSHLKGRYRYEIIESSKT